MQNCEWKEGNERLESCSSRWNYPLPFHQRPLGGGGPDLRLLGVHGGDEALQTQRVQRLRAADVHARRLQEHGQSREKAGLVHKVLSWKQQTSQPPSGLRGPGAGGGGHDGGPYQAPRGPAEC